MNGPVTQERRNHGLPSPRPFVWLLHMALPLVGLWVLLVRPDFDLGWEDHLAHLVVVGASTAVSMAFALLVGRVATQRRDARLTLVSLAFLASAGAFFLHSLTTPGVISMGPNLNFLLSTPVGLALASVFMLASSHDLSEPLADRIVRWRLRLVLLIGILLAAWGVASFVPPLSAPPDPATAATLLIWLAVPTAALFLIAALRYWRLYRRRRSLITASLITALVLLAEAVSAIPLSDNWKASWWLWHVLMAIAYGFVVYSATLAYERDRSLTAVFHGLSLEGTIASVRAQYREALDAYLAALTSGRSAGGSRRLAERFELSEGQVEILEQAADALSAEREQIARLDALASAARSASVGVGERQLLENAMALVGPAFVHDRLVMFQAVTDRTDDTRGRLRRIDEVPDGPAMAPDDEATASKIEALANRALGGDRVLRERYDGADMAAVAIRVRDEAVGAVVLIRRQGDLTERERSVIEALAGQLSVELENVRLYRQVDMLFRQYLSPTVATTLLADPGQAALGGTVHEATILFADLRGFTPFSERVDPADVVRLLNDYFSAAVPVILAEGGTVIQFVGDALMAIFNAPEEQPDHPLHASRAGLAMQRIIGSIATGHEEWPRFRVGINTGPVLVGNVGSQQVRTFTAIGDATNLAARLQGLASEGQVVVGAATYEHIREVAQVRPLGALEIKGKREPVEAYELISLDGVEG